MKWIIICASISLSFAACKADKKTVIKMPEVQEETTSNKVSAIPKGPIINIIDTVEIKQTVLCIKDSAATMEGMKEKLFAIFSKKIPDAILLGKIKITGEPIVWYKSKITPYFFQAGIPVNKAPAKISKGMFMVNTGGDSALVAHFFGPNELTSVGYDALTEMLKENNKKNIIAPYEVYVDNNFLELNKNKDPYKLQINIVMPHTKK